MMLFDEFTVIQELHKGASFVTMRVLCPHTQQKMILKTPLAQWLNPIENAKLQQEYALFKSLDPTSSKSPLRLEQYGSRNVLVFEDFKDQTLLEFSKKERISISFFFNVALNLSRIVCALHGHNIVLKNMHPNHILFDEDTCQLQLLHIDLLSDTAQQHKEEYNYISPEHTGRLNYPVDKRSDLYTLGIILYEMLTQSLPFVETDPLALVHAHVAKIPEDPATLRGDIPSYLSRMILKLLEKSPDQRYQQSSELLKELQNCQRLYSGEATNQTLSPSKRFLHTSALSQKMYAREKEMELLAPYFNENSLKGNEVILISGASGVGKTKLVQEMQKLNSLQHTLSATAKFDVQKTNIPYSALIAALRTLVQKILTQEQAALDFWKNRFHSKLGRNIELMTDIIPELLLFSESNGPIQALPPEESQNRFNHTFSSFLAAMATPEHPLVLFLDDLHWADMASLTQLEHFLLDPSIKGLLFISTYRDTEVDAQTPLYLTLQKIAQRRTVQQIHLKALGLDTVHTMLSEQLQVPPAQIQALATLFHTKTLGNPFFLNQFLLSLHKDEDLDFDANIQQWVWNSNNSGILQITDNVANFLIAKIQDLDFTTMELLKAASCIGDEFGLEILSHVAGFSTHATAQQLEVAIVQQLLSPVEFPREPSPYLQDKHLFRFSHDKIRQAIGSFLQEHEQQMFKMKTGYYLLHSLDSGDSPSNTIFTIADHLNYAEPILKGPDKTQNLVQLNYRAGIYAKNANAYEAAIGYFAMGKKHLNFTEHYTQLFDFYLQSAECEYLNGDYNTSDQNLNEALRYAKSKLDKLAIYKIKCHLYTSMDDKVKAVKAGIEGLKLLNIYIPTQKLVVNSLLIKELLHAKWKLPTKHIDAVLDKPILQSEEKVKALELMLTLAPPAYQYNQNIFALLVLKLLNISLKHGNTGVSSHGLLGYGMISSSLNGDYATGEKLAQVALALNVKLKYTSIKWKLQLAYHNFVIHWTKPISNELNTLFEIEQGALKDGDLIYAGYAIGTRLIKMFALGFSLDAVRDEFEKYRPILEQRGDLETIHILSPYFQVITFLCTATPHQACLPSFFNDDTFIEKAKHHSSYTVIAEYYIAKLILSYTIGDITAGISALKAGQAYMAYVNTRYEICLYHFYATLLLIKARDAQPSHMFLQQKKIRGHLTKLEDWATSCPDNFEAFWLLALAENHHSHKRHDKAPQTYEKAIESATKYGFHNLLALAYELASHYYQSQKVDKIAYIYGQKAKEAYQQWGAVAKVSLFNSQVPFPTKLTSETQPLTHSNQLFSDTAYLLKAAAAISNEGDMDSLFERLIKIVMENACADRGLFLKHQKGMLFVKAQYNIASNKVVLSDKPIDNDIVPISLLRYVERTHTTLLMNKEQLGSTFDHDPYFKNHRPQSILCFPIIGKKELQGIFYLENSVSENVFTQSHLDSLSLLSGQISVSISNTELKKAQEDHMLDLQKATLETQEKEKRRIAQDLHDEIGVNLSAIRLLVKQLKRKLDLLPAYNTTADMITEAIDATISTSRRIAHDLMPSSLEKLGLAESLEGLCQELDEASDIEITFSNTCESNPILDKTQQVHLYRIVKEAINNALKHASAQKIALTLGQDQRTLVVSINDNGTGFSLENSRKQGIGIKSIENRCCLIQAQLLITSTSGLGTEIAIALAVNHWESAFTKIESLN